MHKQVWSSLLRLTVQLNLSNSRPCKECKQYSEVVITAKGGAAPQAPGREEAVS